MLHGPIDRGLGPGRRSSRELPRLPLRSRGGSRARPMKLPVYSGAAIRVRSGGQCEWRSVKDTRAAVGPIRSLFKTTLGRAIEEIRTEIERLGATQLIISSNRALRRGGFPMAARSGPRESGFAVY